MYITGDAILVDCAFLGNSAGIENAGTGGAMHIELGNTTLANCSFIGNSTRLGGAGSRLGGAGVFNAYRANTALINCVFASNSADDEYGLSRGGGILNYGIAALANCTFNYNVAALQGGGVFHDSSSGGHVSIANCVLWGNSDRDGMDESAQIHSSNGAVIINSCVQGWSGSFGGAGNMGDDPMLTDPDGPDDTPGTEDDDLRLLPGSPCIDAGDNTAVPADVADLDGNGDILERTPLDLAGMPRFVDDPLTEDTGVADSPDYPEVVDMGAYEFRDVGSKD